MTVDPELSPRISVVCPTYNSELFIGRTISSILAQTRLPVEIVLVDDGSKDGTLASLNAAAFTHPEVRWQILHGAQRGPGAARNRGIGAAIGDWVAFLDSDDLWLPAKLEMVARAIQSNSVVNVVCHGEISRDQAGNERPLALGDLYQPGIPLARQLYRRNFFSTSAVVCRRELLLTAGLFDETLSSVQDYELWLRMAGQARPLFLPDILGIYILREGSITRTRRLRRTLNQLRIACRHRRLGTWPDFAYKVIWIAASLLKDGLSAAVRKLIVRK